MLPFALLWHIYLMACLIALAMQVAEFIISHELGLLARLTGSVASAFNDGALHRDTSNWNHRLNVIAVLDSFMDPQTRPSRKQLRG